MQQTSVAVIDDDQFHLQFLGSHFSDLGAAVTTFSSGEDFLRHVIDVEKGVFPWDLVVVDYLMPVLDGMQTIMNFTSKMLGDTMVCMVTGSEDQGIDMSYLANLGMKVVRKTSTVVLDIWSDLTSAPVPTWREP